jgi:hypothetical protein
VTLRIAGKRCGRAWTSTKGTQPASQPSRASTRRLDRDPGAETAPRPPPAGARAWPGTLVAAYHARVARLVVGSGVHALERRGPRPGAASG